MENETGRGADTGVRGRIIEINSSSTRKAMELVNAGGKCSLVDLIFRPIFSFIGLFLLRGGFLKGVGGFITSMLAAYEEFVTRLKVWELRHVDGSKTG